MPTAAELLANGGAATGAAATPSARPTSSFRYSNPSALARPLTSASKAAPLVSSKAIPGSAGWKGKEREIQGPPAKEVPPTAATSAAASSATGSRVHGMGPPRSASKHTKAAAVGGKVGGSTGGKGKGKEHAGTDSLRTRMAGPSDQKAGLLRDPEEVKQIIWEASKGSKFFLDQQRRDEELTVKVNALTRHLDSLVRQRGGDLRAEQALVDQKLAEYERRRDLSQTVVVVDCDAFYASCETKANPKLEGKAFAVGSGVLTTASYEARKYGCRSAMAGFVARKLCPHLIFVPLNFPLYTAASKDIFTILRQYGDMSPASLDEASNSRRPQCSLTEYCRLNGVTPAEAARRMREQVKKETGLTVSAGVSPNSMISKIAADLNKPDGQFVVEPTREACIAFMKDLPIRKVPGIGRVSERWLQALGVLTVGDIYAQRGKLYLVRGQIGLDFLCRAYLGLGSTTISHGTRAGRKGIGCEQTFHPTSKPDALFGMLRKIAKSLAEDMRKSGYSGRTINLKLKHDTYESITRARTLGKDIYFNDADTLYREGERLLKKEIANRAKAVARGDKVKGGGKEFSLRLIGLRMSNLRDDRKEKKSARNLNKWKKDDKGVGGSNLPKDEDTDEDEDDGEDSDFGHIEDEEDRAEVDREDEEEAAQGDDDQGGTERGIQVPKKRFIGSSSKEGGSAELSDERVRELECPVCGRTFEASPAAMAAHVAAHFGDDEPAKGSSKRKTAGAPPRGKKKPRLLDSFLTKS